MKAQEEIDTLIIRKLTGTAKPEELLTLENWLENNKSNQRYAAQMQSIWEKSADSKVFASIDLDANWNRFQGLSNQHKVRNRSAYAVWWQVAAVIFLVVGGGWLGYTYWLNQQEVLIASHDQAVSHHLPDGSLVYLYPKARLEYNKMHFESSGRAVNFEGKAYFQIENKASAERFTIHSRNNEVIVLGTAFTFDTDSEQGSSNLTLYEGSVLFASGKDSVILEPGEKIIYNNSVLKKDRFQQDSPIPELNNTPLAEILDALSKKYLVEFYYEDEWPSCTLTGNLEAKTLDETLEYLEFILGLKYTIQGQLIIINQITCNP
jgi:ferric-dicitrate binding protein FerR (iron transport regulator)